MSALSRFPKLSYRENVRDFFISEFIYILDVKFEFFISLNL